MKKQISFILSSLFIVGCSGGKFVQPSTSPITKIAQQPLETIVISDDVERVRFPEEALKTWPHSDVNTQLFPGMNLDAAYKLLNNVSPTTVIVGVIDSGVDINHEDLKDVIWTNSKEIPDNGIDDDHNGYVDDIHGWNFLGQINQAPLEMVRMLRSSSSDSEDYRRALAEYQTEIVQAEENLKHYQDLLNKVVEADKVLKKLLGKDVYTNEELSELVYSNKKHTTQETEALQEMLKYMLYMDEETSTSADILKRFTEGVSYFENKVKYQLNKDFYPRRDILKDDENDFSVTSYGNNNVIGPVLDDALHGTHVAGIIAAKRNNGIGMNGVANDVKIMCIRAVPDGDEYDKDIAMAIRYAVDNGAKVLNTSFGKAYSPHWKQVHKAIQYAAEHDVLIVNAAGNDFKNIDKDITYPNDDVNGVEISDNMITVGALNYTYGLFMVAPFSNYGKESVDIFAPGVKIWSTVPGNKYEFLQGTSMASPEVAGLAALIRSYFPDLTASQVKKVILESGLAYNKNVAVSREKLGEEQIEQTDDKINDKGEQYEEDTEGVIGLLEAGLVEKPFSDFSKTGRFINAYNAVILASKMSNSNKK